MGDGSDPTAPPAGIRGSDGVWDVGVPLPDVMASLTDGSKQKKQQ